MAEVITSSPHHDAGLTQSTTTTTTTATTTATATATTTPPLAPHTRWPSLPINLLNLLNPFTQPADGDPGDNNNHDPVKPTPESQLQPASTLRRPVLSAVQFHEDGSAPPSPSRSSASIMFAEPDTRSTSEAGSREGSISDRKRSRRSTRPKERLSICHPVPESKVKQRLHRQPRSLLQLHRLQPNARPLPALEVIPSANFSVRLTRAITKAFHAKHGFCANDLVVLKAEKYGTQDEEVQARDVIGLICKGSREEQKTGSGKMLIHMASGKQWEAYATSNGAYECCTTDEHGLKETVRWVPKKNKDGRGVSTDGTRKFNFSTISPHTRRHPVIANLQKTALDINDSYKIPEPTANTPLGTPSLGATILDDAFDEDVGGQNESVTDDATRQIIYLTAIWVAMREGWSPNFRYEDKRESSLAGEPPHSPARSVTNPALSPPSSPSPYASLEKRASIRSFGSGIVRRASVMSRSKRNSAASVMEESDAESPAPSRSASITKLGPAGRTRADSSATVLVHRAASNRRKKTEAMTNFRPDLVSEDDLHETSREDLSTRLSGDTPKKPRPSALARKSMSRPVTDGTRSTSTASEGWHDAGRVESPPPTPEEKPGHRTSTTTDGTTSTRQPSDQRQQGHHPMPEIRPEGKPRRIRGWRKLLCGASKMD